MQRKQSVQIHARGGQGRLDAVLELVAFAAKPCPLSTSLDELPKKIATILSVDVCSIYLLEGEDLVMRGNVGFHSSALGEVRMQVGEGITGLAVEYMRPVSTASASTHEGYRHFPGLGEEKFPVFLAVPVVGASGPLGALVLQRALGQGFEQTEIELAAALTAPIAAATERAHLREALHGERRTNPAGGTRRVTLTGRSVVPGRVVGTVAAVRRPASKAPSEKAPAKKEAKRALEHAIAGANDTLSALIKDGLSRALDVQQLRLAQAILADGRLSERTLELVDQGDGLSIALQRVAAEAAREAARSREDFLIDRAREMSDICEALAMLTATDRRTRIGRGSVLVGDRITTLDLLVTARSEVSAVVLSEAVATPAARLLLLLLGVPSVAHVAGLFRWVTEGELLLVDADHGFVRVNPSRAEISALRVEQKNSG
jgi:phosphotransferase system enzyme I (PtsP)